MALNDFDPSTAAAKTVGCANLCWDHAEYRHVCVCLSLSLSLSSFLYGCFFLSLLRSLSPYLPGSENPPLSPNLPVYKIVSQIHLHHPLVLFFFCGAEHIDVLLQHDCLLRLWALTVGLSLALRHIPDTTIGTQSSAWSPWGGVRVILVCHN